MKTDIQALAASLDEAIKDFYACRRAAAHAPGDDDLGEQLDSALGRANQLAAQVLTTPVTRTEDMLLHVPAFRWEFGIPDFVDLSKSHLGAIDDFRLLALLKLSKDAERLQAMLGQNSPKH